jgi:hypothetical protein
VVPAADAVLLPLALGLTLLGIIVVIVSGRRGNKGRLLQGIALALTPVALYLSGLLRLLWDGVVAVGRWASAVVLSPPVWAGLGLLALCLVLWVVGGFVARRTPKRPRGKQAKQAAAAGSSPAGQQAAVAGRGAKPAGRSQQPAAQDDDMAEIEALLKSRGIE